MEVSNWSFILTLIIVFVDASEAAEITYSKAYVDGQCEASQYGTYRVALQFCDGKNWRILQPGKNTKTPQGTSCLDIKNKGLSYGDGEYMIDPHNDGENKPFVVHCDMTSFGGGWTMCYTTDSMVDIKTELKTNPYHGYRADCNDIPFTAVMFLDEKSKRKAVFTKNGSAITFTGNYNKKADAFGLWTAQGVADAKYKYQMVICNMKFYKGIIFSGFTNCYNKCNRWCDQKPPYFRTSTSSESYAGVVFNQHSGYTRPNRLVSVAIR